MTENERKIAELNRLYDETSRKHQYLEELIETSKEEKWELFKKLEKIGDERRDLIELEIDKYYNLK
jgi:hypothetical protein